MWAIIVSKAGSYNLETIQEQVEIFSQLRGKIFVCGWWILKQSGKEHESCIKSFEGNKLELEVIIQSSPTFACYIKRCYVGNYDRPFNRNKEEHRKVQESSSSRYNKIISNDMSLLLFFSWIQGFLGKNCKAKRHRFPRNRSQTGRGWDEKKEEYTDIPNFHMYLCDHPSFFLSTPSYFLFSTREIESLCLLKVKTGRINGVNRCQSYSLFLVLFLQAQCSFDVTYIFDDNQK